MKNIMILIILVIKTIILVAVHLVFMPLVIISDALKLNTLRYGIEHIFILCFIDVYKTMLSHPTTSFSAEMNIQRLRRKDEMFYNEIMKGE